MVRLLGNILFAPILVCLLHVVSSHAAHEIAAEKIEVETSLTGLAAPHGVAIRPGGAADRYEIVVVDSGAGRIMRAWSHEPDKADEIITGFEKLDSAQESFPVGPAAAMFVDRNLLLVGITDKRSRASLRLYNLASTDLPLNQDQFEQKVELESSKLASDSLRQHIDAFARVSPNDLVMDAAIFTTSSNEGSGRLWKIPLRAGTLDDASQFEEAETPFQLNGPAGVALGDRGYIVVGNAGTSDASSGVHIAFVNPIDGTIALELPTELHGIVALAYSPKSGSLYALDISDSDPEKSGLYRIDDASTIGKPASKAVKLANIARPTAMTFAPDGTLYITTLGEPKGQEPNTGALLKVTGNL